jgi:microcompartment protein CcmK/EutM
MLLAKVIGNVWSTKKLDTISALRLLFIQPLFNKGKPIPIDAVVVGIADNLELVDDAPVKKK